MDINFTDVETISYLPKIIDIHNTPNYFYILRENHTVEIYTKDLKLSQSITLQKQSKRCLKIYVDDTTMMVGFEDGTMELRQINENYNILRITSDKDPGGPGSKRILQIGASSDFVLVQSYENGLLIYTKPSLLFYKWIMLGGHCEISQFSIKYHLLYVLVMRPEHEIHMLDFEKHRIFEQEVMAYDYIDIEFDGLYLYTATKTSVIVYLQEEAKRPMKQYRVAQVNFSDTITHLVRFNDDIYVVFNDKLVKLDILVEEIRSPSISPGDVFPIMSNNFANQLKYDYFSSQSHDQYPKHREILFLDGEKLKMISLS